MTLHSFFQKLPRPGSLTLGRRARHGGDRLLDDEQLRAALYRERMRADRTGGMFAFVVFHADSAATLGELADRLARRLRLTDDMGRWETGIGVLLPQTSREAANTFAASVCEPLGESQKIIWTISLYPTEPPLPDESSSAESEARGPSSPTVAASATAGGLSASDTAGAVLDAAQLFIRPLPWWKRTCDIVAASVGLVLAAPVLAVAAVAIRLTSPGPVFFVQWRSGLGGRPFRIYKLRTMVVDADQQKSELRALSEQDGPAFKIKDDPRITRVGKYLRKTCIDELPQLWNVLRGDMTLVGPRPLPCDESAACLNWQRQRLDVTPGLTCTWQVRSGRSRIAFADWMRLDIQYIRGRNLRQDIRLVWKTFVAVVMHRASH